MVSAAAAAAAAAAAVVDHQQFERYVQLLVQETRSDCKVQVQWSKKTRHWQVRCRRVVWIRKSRKTYF